MKEQLRLPIRLPGVLPIASKFILMSRYGGDTKGGN